MAVRIGHASIDERGRVSGGAAGDQTGREVCTRSWYNKPWIAVIRPKEKSAAEKIARAMEQACANNNIGYDQSQRTTLFTQAKAKNWNLAAIRTKCETDCSALVAVCVNAAGIPVSKDIYTGNEKSALLNTGGFTAYTESKYISTDRYLKRGDILLAKGHTAVVLGNGAQAMTPSAGKVQTSNTGMPTIRKGNKGDAVRKMQNALLSQRFRTCVIGNVRKEMKADGDWGEITDSIFRRWQGYVGLNVDGICGPKSWTKLGY